MSTTNGGPKIITNGLVLYLDAANPKSYLSGSTKWNDLSGRESNGTLTNGPTYNSLNGGNILFDGVDDYVTGSMSNLNEYTLCIMVKVLSYKAGGGVFGGINTSNVFIQLGGGYAFQFNYAFVSVPPPLSQWTYVVGVQTSSSIQSLYIDGSFKSSASPYVSSLGLGYVIGRREIGNVYINSQVGIAQIYNRALNAVEIQQNYNTTKTRFGL